MRRLRTPGRRGLAKRAKGPSPWLPPPDADDFILSLQSQEESILQLGEKMQGALKAMTHAAPQSSVLATHLYVAASMHSSDCVALPYWVHAL
jgi:hypothetical protein